MDAKRVIVSLLLILSLKCYSQSDTLVSASPLPLVWDNIHVHKNISCNNVIDWITLEEYHAREFLLQRSFDGHNFIVFRKITASPTLFTYQLEDPEIKVDVFYRIVSIDIDGRASYSKIVSSKSSLKIDNVFFDGKSKLHIQIQSQANKEVRIMDMNGRIMFSSKTNADKRTIDVSHFTSGIYLIQIEGLPGTIKFVKN